MRCVCHSWVSSMAEKQAHIAKLTAQIDELHQRCTQLKRSLGHSQVHEETDVAMLRKGSTASQRSALLAAARCKGIRATVARAAQLRSFHAKLLQQWRTSARRSLQPANLDGSC